MNSGSARAPVLMELSPAILPPDVTLFEFATNETLFAGLNPKADSWWAWDVVFKVLSHMELDPREDQFFRKVTGGIHYDPREEIPGIIVIVLGRKAAKSTKTSQIALYRSLQFDPYSLDPPLSPGEWVRNLVVAPASRASRITVDFCDGQINELVRNTGIDNPVLKRNFTEQQNILQLTNGCILATQPVNRVTGRGPSTYTLILEEGAHFKKEGHFSDTQIFKAIRPGMARFGKRSLCIMITSPDTKEGLVWMFYKRFFGVKNPIALVINGETRDFNPTIDEEFLDQEEELFAGDDMEGDLELDEDYVEREYKGKFTDASAAAFSSRAVDACVREEKEIPYSQEHDYFAFADPSSLSPGTTEFNDEFAIGVGHIEARAGRQKRIVDAVRAWSPDQNARNFASPEEAIKDAAAFFNAYDIELITGDEWSARGVSTRFTELGFGFEIVDLSKSDLYREFLPVINNQDVELPPEPVANQQLKGLERKRAAGDKIKIDHPKRRKDDRANVYAGLSYLAELQLAACANSIFARFLKKITTATTQTGALKGHSYGAGLFWPKEGGCVVLSVIDTCCKQHCFQLRTRKSEYKKHVLEIQEVVKKFDLMWILAERERIGESLFDQLQMDGLPIQPHEAEGKNFAIEALLNAAQNEDISITSNRYLLREMRVFICEALQSGFVRYRSVGYQGGCVFALALAWCGAREIVSLTDIKLGGNSRVETEFGTAENDFSGMLLR